MSDRMSSFIMGVVFGFVIGVVAGVLSSVDVEQKSAIKHGAAFYHSETGEFTWRNLKE